MGESFTEDIFIDILLRLPAKSLVRFKCVCKRWRSLISDPGFVKSHLHRLKAGDLVPSQRIIIGGRNCPLETIDYEALDGGRGRVVVPHRINPLWEPRLVGSCDGLVCLLVPGIFLIYNPTTGECIKLCCSDFVQEIVHGFGDENELYRGFSYEHDLFRGFGYDSRSDDYKIVEGRIVEGVDDSEEWQVAIFSLKSGSWRTVQLQFQEESHLEVSGPGVYWNGALHWCVLDWVVDGCLKQKAVIMSFDLLEEKFHRELPVPEVDGDVSVFVGLGIHGDSLFIYNSGHDPRIEAWITDENGRGASWTKLFSVDCIPAFVNWDCPLGKNPVAYTRSGKIVFRMDVRQMILLNPEDNTCKDCPTGRDDGVIEYAIYLETLVSPYLGGEPSRI